MEYLNLLGKLVGPPQEVDFLSHILKMTLMQQFGKFETTFVVKLA